MTASSGSLVVDASAVVGLLTAQPDVGDWLADELRDAAFAAPSLLWFEAANVIRRHAQARLLDATAAQLAHDDLLDLQIESWPYEALADRVWKLRGQLTAYDASYVALAELVGAPLVTLDHRLARCRVATCEFRTPPRRRSVK